MFKYYKMLNFYIVTYCKTTSGNSSILRVKLARRLKFQPSAQAVKSPERVSEGRKSLFLAPCQLASLTDFVLVLGASLLVREPENMRLFADISQSCLVPVRVSPRIGDITERN